MAVFMMVVDLGLAAVLIGGCLLVLGGTLTAEAFLLCMFLALAFFAPMMGMADMLGFNRIIRNAVRNLNEFLKTPLLPEPAHSERPAGFDIGFDRVSFGYDDHRVLNEVSFTIPEKSLVALVGPSGSGKTRITNLTW